MTELIENRMEETIKPRSGPYREYYVDTNTRILSSSRVIYVTGLIISVISVYSTAEISESPTGTGPMATLYI